MYNSDEVMGVLADIAVTSAKTQKDLKVTRACNDNTFMKTCQYAYDPFKTFGILPKKLEGKGAGTFNDEGEVWELLDTLADRAVTGNAAKDGIEKFAATLTQDSAELLRRILIKDLRASFTHNSVNRGHPGSIRVFEVMLAEPFEAKRVKKWPVRVEPKLDGVRVITIVDENGVAFYSRTGKPFLAVDHMKDHVARMVKRAYENTTNHWVQNMMLDGTIVLDGEIVSGTFNKTVGDIRRKEEAALDAVYTIFDMIPLADFMNYDIGTLEEPLTNRSDLVRHITSFSPTPNIKQVEIRTAESIEEVMELYNSYRARGLEGAIVKPLCGFYHKKRNFSWMKIKNEETVDIPVKDAYEGEGKYVGCMGGLIGDLDGIDVSVGGGFSDEQRVALWKAYRNQPDQLLGRLMEVEFHEKTPDGSLRHPRFIRFRDDKTQ